MASAIAGSGGGQVGQEIDDGKRVCADQSHPNSMVLVAVHRLCESIAKLRSEASHVLEVIDKAARSAVLNVHSQSGR